MGNGTETMRYLSEKCEIYSKHGSMAPLKLSLRLLRYTKSFNGQHGKYGSAKYLILLSNKGNLHLQTTLFIGLKYFLETPSQNTDACWSIITPPSNENICIPFVQRRPNVFDVGPTLYKCCTNVVFTG